LGGIGQTLLDRFWGVMGNCPITIVLALAAAGIAALGVMRDPVRTHPVAWRNAH
jgi:hypothetical protein